MNICIPSQRELAKSLFDLKCTLGHPKDLLLSGGVSLSANPTVQANLSLLLRNCGDTLNQLDTILKVYEEKVVVRGEGTHGNVVRGGTASNRPSRRRS